MGDTRAGSLGLAYSDAVSGHARKRSCSYVSTRKLLPVGTTVLVGDKLPQPWSVGLRGRCSLSLHDISSQWIARCSSYTYVSSLVSRVLRHNRFVGPDAARRSTARRTDNVGTRRCRLHRSRALHVCGL